ncbi:cytochrome P450 [Streptomyces sp. S07_1.15]|uniref:cytochrome P450 family protein n=1 Tax=Streptomyces sp. S07_1.15 TaxID=2873925 RepID=UPI001D14D4DF|nr:cytochrome P450 [Streptomyces sp. S07_1.15]MCC3654039.1 cytochrome P450 [Streptomyces sp. S07_1.15]
MTQARTEPIVLDPTGADPHTEARLLRDRGPAARILLPGGFPAWSITRPEVIRALLTDDTRVSKDPRHWPAWRDGQVPDGWPLAALVRVTSMLTQDGENHRRLRAISAPAFAPRRIEALRARVTAITTDLLDALEAAADTLPDQPIDLYERLAHPLPTRLICDLFGVPRRLRPDALRAVDGVLATAATPQQAADTIQNLDAVMEALLREKEAEPGDDMATDLLTASGNDGRPLTRREMLDTLALMIGAGAETAVNLIAYGIAELLAHPDQLRLAASGDVPWDAVVEEVLRLHPPIMHMPLRFATTDIHLPRQKDGEPDVTIRAGEPILPGFGAVGRDPDLHHNPDAFDITRTTKAHMTFGHGPHYCLGAALGRMEAAVALPALFDRFPAARLAVPRAELTPLPSFIAHGLSALPVHLTRPAT